MDGSHWLTLSKHWLHDKSINVRRMVECVWLLGTSPLFSSPINPITVPPLVVMAIMPCMSLWWKQVNVNRSHWLTSIVSVRSYGAGGDLEVHNKGLTLSTSWSRRTNSLLPANTIQHYDITYPPHWSQAVLCGDESSLKCGTTWEMLITCW